MTSISNIISFQPSLRPALPIVLDNFDYQRNADILRRIDSAPMPFFVKPVARGITGKVRGGYLDANVQRNLDFMEASLTGSDWFVGDRLSGADIQMSFAVECAEARADLSAGYPALNAFLKRIRARPAWKAALEKGGPYQIPGSD